jgi:hypothetical protein
LEAFEVLDGSAVLAVGLGLVSEEQGEGFAVVGHEVEAFGQRVGLAQVCAFDELGAGLEGGGEEAGFETVGTEDRKLGQGDALYGELLLGGLRAVAGDGVGDQVVEGVAFLEADDGEGRGGEAVLAGIRRGAGFAFGGAGSGGPGGVGPVGSELFFGEGLHRDFDLARRQAVLRNSDS